MCSVPRWARPVGAWDHWNVIFIPAKHIGRGRGHDESLSPPEACVASGISSQMPFLYSLNSHCLVMVTNGLHVLDFLDLMSILGTKDDFQPAKGKH